MAKDPEAIGIYQRNGIYWLAFQKNLKRRYCSLETSDYAEAITRAREIRVRPGLNVAQRFLDEVETFINYKIRRREFTAASAQGRFYILRHFANVVDVPVAAVTPRMVQSFYDSKVAELCEVTANSYAMILRSFYNWARDVAHLVHRNPVDGLELARESSVGIRMKDFLSEKQRDALIKSCTREDLEFVLYMGFHAGLRKNEIIEARPWWFDLHHGLLHLRTTDTMKFKDREERTIPLTKGFAGFIGRYGLREPYMLQPKVKKGKNRYRYDFSRPFFEHCMAQKLERVGQTRVTPHLMRHTFASLLVSRGVSLYKVARWMGDDPRVVEKHYARLVPNDPDIEKAFHEEISKESRKAGS